MTKNIHLRIAGTEITHSLQITEEATAEDVLGMIGLSSSDYDLVPGVGFPPFSTGERPFGRVQEGGKLIAVGMTM